MKNIILALLAVQLTPFTILAAPPVRSDTGETARSFHSKMVKHEDLNSRVWENVWVQTNQNGQASFKTNSYTEIEAGMNYRAGNGQLKESRAFIELAADGTGVANEGQHKVVFASNINTRGSLRVTTPENQHLKSHVLGIGYYDYNKKESVVIATIKDSIGTLVDDNHVIYSDAFNDLKADVQYTYTKGGLEQDVIFRERPPLPESFGFNPRTTWIEVWTEFVEFPEPAIDQGKRRGPKEFKMDKVIDFGTMKMTEGFAFSSAGGKKNRLPVNKHWELVDGRRILVEEVSFRGSIPALRELPERPLAETKRKQGKGQVARVRRLPNIGTSEKKPGEKILVAKLSGKDVGFVVDFPLTLVNATNFTFKGDTTYLVSGNINLSGTTTIEGGTVIKYTNYAAVNILGTVNCLTDSYRPAIFTSSRDDSVGEIVSLSDGLPSYTNSIGIALYLFNGGTVKNVRVSYADYGIFGAAQYTVKHSQFYQCISPIFTEYANVTAENILMHSVYAAFSGTWFNASVSHLTYDSGSYVTVDPGYDPDPECGCEECPTTWPPSSSMAITNSLITQVPSDGDVPLSTNNVTRLASGAGVYQTVGAAGFYLAEASPYRNTGTTNIVSTLKTEFRKKTTYPPIVYSSLAVSSDTVLSPQAHRDTDTPDLGFHYDPLDYVFGGVDITNAIVQITAGTAIGTYTPSVGYGMTVGPGGKISTQGTPTNLNYIVFYNSVQEQSNTNWTSLYPLSFLCPWEDSQPSSEANFRFTIWATPSSPAFHFMSNTDAGLTNVYFQDCQFYGGYINIESRPSSYFTNNLFSRVMLTIYPPTALLFNNTFHGGYFGYYDGSGTFVFKDNLFTQTYIDAWSDVTNAYNGYYNATNRLTPTNVHDVVSLTNFTFLTGALGNFYIPTNSALRNAGSQNATNAGLYHFTTLTNQVKETNTQVDIGFHYVAVSSSGQAIDGDSDGVPDYLEDANGNGTVDTGENSWTNYTSGNGLTGSTGIQVYTPLRP